ncbi:MAG: hypothetical protein HQL06_15435 [Nitrospirae bacterium]|nr:hypothetical protein [Nitrospirota bacterium]
MDRKQKNDKSTYTNRSKGISNMKENEQTTSTDDEDNALENALDKLEDLDFDSSNFNYAITSLNQAIDAEDRAGICDAFLQLKDKWNNMEITFETVTETIEKITDEYEAEKTKMKDWNEGKAITA